MYAGLADMAPASPAGAMLGKPFRDSVLGVAGGMGALNARTAPPSRGRLLKALAGSALLHAVVLLGVGSLAPGLDIPATPAGVLTVTLAYRQPVGAEKAEAPELSAQALPAAGDAIAENGGRHARNVGVDADRQAMPERPVSIHLPAGTHYYAAHDLDEVAKPVNDVLLRYPPQAYAQGIAGEVRLRLLIDSAGRVDEAEVISAQPQDIFDAAAREAAIQLQFSPALRQGQAVSSEKVIAIVFDPSAEPLR